MSWVAVAVGGATVVGGALSADAAKDAAKPRESFTDQTTEQTPFAPTVPHLERILQEQLRLYNQGPPDYRQALGGGGTRGVGARGEEAMDIYRQAAERGFGASSTPGMEFAQGAIGDIWSGKGTGFEGYNPILSGVANELGGSSLGVPNELLMQFLSENQRALGQGGAGGGEPNASISRPARAGGFSFSGGGGGGGGMVPDTGAGSGTFQRELDRIFSEEANEEEIAALLDSVAGDILEQGNQQVSDLEARAAGTGRFGGSWHAARLSDAKERQAEEIAAISAQLRYGDLEARRNARLQAMNMLNSRDVAAMQDRTANRSISASAGSAAAGRELSERLASMENQRLLRGQDLQAISALMQGQQFGLSGLMGLGDRLSADRLASLGMIPQFEGLGLAGVDRALQAAGGMTGLEQMDSAARSRNAANRQRISMLQLEAPQRMLNDYLRTVGAIGGMGGTSHTEGQNVVEGPNISSTNAFLQGALGAGGAAAGIAGQAGLFGSGQPQFAGGATGYDVPVGVVAP